MTQTPRHRKPSRTVKTAGVPTRGNLRIGDHWNAIAIIALSQSNPLKAVAELVETADEVVRFGESKPIDRADPGIRFAYVRRTGCPGIMPVAGSYQGRQAERRQQTRTPLPRSASGC